MACGHICPKPCHDQVLVKVQDTKKASTPWENKGIICVKIQIVHDLLHKNVILTLKMVIAHLFA